MILMQEYTISDVYNILAEINDNIIVIGQYNINLFRVILVALVFWGMSVLISSIVKPIVADY